jgi:hypothetical protein
LKILKVPSFIITISESSRGIKWSQLSFNALGSELKKNSFFQNHITRGDQIFAQINISGFSLSITAKAYAQINLAVTFFIVVSKSV